jgi:hypothetical protein
VSSNGTDQRLHARRPPASVGATLTLIRPKLLRGVSRECRWRYAKSDDARSMKRGTSRTAYAAKSLTSRLLPAYGAHRRRGALGPNRRCGTTPARRQASRPIGDCSCVQLTAGHPEHFEPTKLDLRRSRDSSPAALRHSDPTGKGGTPPQVDRDDLRRSQLVRGLLGPASGRSSPAILLVPVVSSLNSPVSWARTTAWTRSRRPSFWRMCVMWVFTVASLM